MIALQRKKIHQFIYDFNAASSPALFSDNDLLQPTVRTSFVRVRRTLCG